MTTDHDRSDHEPRHAESPTAALLAELQLYGHRPFQDEPDPRPLPEERTIRTALADIFDALMATLTSRHRATQATDRAGPEEAFGRVGAHGRCSRTACL